MQSILIWERLGMVGKTVLTQLNSSFTAIRRSSPPAFLTMPRHHVRKNAGGIFMLSAIARQFRLCRELVILPTQTRQQDIAALKALAPFTHKPGGGSFGRDKCRDQLINRLRDIANIRTQATATAYLIKQAPIEVRATIIFPSFPAQ